MVARATLSLGEAWRCCGRCCGMSGGRAHVVQGALESEPVELQPGEAVCRVIENRGANSFQVEDAQGSLFLCLLPAKFHKKLWLKRGSYVVVQMADLGASEPTTSCSSADARANGGSPSRPGPEEATGTGEHLHGTPGAEAGLGAGAGAGADREDRASAGAGAEAEGGSSVPGAEPHGLGPQDAAPAGPDEHQQAACQEEGQGAPRGGDSAGAGAAAATPEEGAAGKRRGGRRGWRSSQPGATPRPTKVAPEAQGAGEHPKGDKGPKVRGVISRVLYRQHLRSLEVSGLWSPFDAGQANSRDTAASSGAREATNASVAPREDSVGGNDGEDEVEENSDSDGSLSPLHENTNRAHHAHMYRDVADSSDEDSDDSEGGK